ncbi:MAG: hypothetical protein KAS32_23890 [Candidatus Peribacteraceae bacterium]|nr:hypothetical protein [Candidatus Peribacteraceae bacterium]
MKFEEFDKLIRLRVKRINTNCGKITKPMINRAYKAATERQESDTKGRITWMDEVAYWSGFIAVKQ